MHAATTGSHTRHFTVRVRAKLGNLDHYPATKTELRELIPGIDSMHRFGTLEWVEPGKTYYSGSMFSSGLGHT